MPDGVWFEEETMNVMDLPISGLDLTIPSLPCSVNEVDYKGNIEKTVEVQSLTPNYKSYGSGSGSLTFSIKAKMTYNSKGNSSSDYVYIGYKIKDSEGVIVDSGSFMVGPLAVGDVVVEEEYASADKINLNGKYTIELYDAR